MTSTEPATSVYVLGATHTIKARHDAYTIIESVNSPGSGLPAHSLKGQDQSIYVLAGEYELATSDGRRTLAAGATAFVPRGTVHSLTVRGADSGRCLLIVNPAGVLESFLEAVARAGFTADPDGIYAIARDTGISLLTSPV